MNRLLSCVLLGAAVCAAAETCAPGDFVWRLRSVSDPQAQPRGNLVAWLESWNDETDDRTYSNLQVVASDGSGARSLTTGKQRVSAPAWSRDGNRLAYVSDRDGRARIYVQDIQTGTEKSINVESAPSALSWSPDGSMLAWTAYVASAPRWAPPMPVPPTGAKWAPPVVAVSTLRWTFDGTGLLQPGGVRIHVASADGGAPRQITRDPYQHTSYLTEPEFQWSHDSRFVIAPAVRNDDGWSVYSGNQIYLFPVTGEGEPQALTAGEGHHAQLRVSPDGKRLAFVGFRWKGQSYHVSHLHEMDLRTRQVTPLTDQWDRDVTAPVWSDDSQRLYFLSEDRGSSNVYEVDLSGTRRQITKGAHRLGSLTRAGDGLVATMTTPTAPPSVVRIDQDHMGVIADPNRAFPCRFLPAEEIWYRSFDGAKIQGWLMKPPGFDPAKRYALLVLIHGGPHGAYGFGFSDEFQTLLSRGYVVLYTNPRGSTGYGEAFGNIQHKWPGDDVKDILAAVDHVVQEGYVDEKRMAVMGGSGGGLMTAWTITQTDRFRAAVALYPVTNWFTHVGTGDNGFYIASVYRKGMPWDYPEDYISHSPLFHVKRVKTPAMIITGDQDWRTPIAQSEEFFRALKVRGAETVFVRVPGEAHGLRKYPSHRVQVVAHILAWLERYLAPAAPPA